MDGRGGDDGSAETDEDELAVATDCPSTTGDVGDFIRPSDEILRSTPAQSLTPNRHVNVRPAVHLLVRVCSRT